MNTNNSGQHKGDWGSLHGKSLADVAGEDGFSSLRGIVGRGMEARLNNIDRVIQTSLRRREVVLNMRSLQADVSWPGRENERQHHVDVPWPEMEHNRQHHQVMPDFR
jgi:hypothetical protein